MSTSLLEIVDLGDGEIVLQRADDDSEPLVVIRFSEESGVETPYRTYSEIVRGTPSVDAAKKRIRLRELRKRRAQKYAALAKNKSKVVQAS